MVYQYVAYNEQGAIVKGTLSAAGEDAVNTMLTYAGYRLINLKPYIPFFSMERFAGEAKVKGSEIILLYRQLALLLESGINIINSLELLQKQVSNRSLKRVLGSIVSDLRSGSQLSATMSKHPKIFSSLACRTLSIGEQTGGIETMLKQIAEYMEKETVAMKGIKSALTYPIITVGVTIIVVGVLVTFVLPAFANLYASMGVKLPAITRATITGANMLKANFLYILLLFFIAGGGGYAYIKTPNGRYNFDKLMLRIVLFGKIRLYNELARICRSISLLFTAGLPLTDIMPLVIQGTSNRVMAKALYEVQQDMLKGEGLSKPMMKNPLFLPMMVQMVKVGEETGSLDNTLLAVAQNYETEAADKTKNLITMIQPVMTVVIAVVVGIVALSMFSAMFSIYGEAF